MENSSIDCFVLVQRFAADLEDFDNQFAHAWYKLTTRDMGPRSRCVNDDAPPAQVLLICTVHIVNFTLP